MFKHSTNDGNIKLAQLNRQIVNIAIKDPCLRLEQAMTEPVSILPSFNFSAILLGPLFSILKIKFVFEGQHGLLLDVAHVKGDDTCSTFFGRKTQKSGSATHVQYGLAGDSNAADVIVEPASQVPVSVDQSKARQVHRVIEEAVFQSFDQTRSGKHCFTIQRCFHRIHRPEN